MDTTQNISSELPWEETSNEVSSELASENNQPGETSQTPAIIELPKEKLIKLRILRRKSGVSYQIVSESEYASVIEKLEADEQVEKIIPFEIPPDSEASRQHKEVMNKLAQNPNAARRPVLAAPTFFSKPYSIAQIDIRDRVQIANFSRQILNDPSDGIFPPIQEQTHEELLACVEFYKAAYDLALETAKRAKLVKDVKAVETIRNEDATNKAEKKKKIEKKLSTSSNHTEAEKNGKEAAKLFGQSAEHKRLLKFVSIMNLKIDGYLQMSEADLKQAVQTAQKQMMGS